MIISAKRISLKDDTLKDIENNNIDTDLFIKRINEYLDKARYLINNKMEDMSPEEFYRALKEIYDIQFDSNDYLKLLSLMNNKHYSKYINIRTNMYDDNGYNVSYLGTATNKSNCLDEDVLDLNTIRKLTSSNDLVLLRPNFKKEEHIPGNKEKYESHLLNYININNETIDEESILYPYACQLVKKEIMTKNMLYCLKLYCDEVVYQLREITGLALRKDDGYLANIGKIYRKAYVKATNDEVILKREKIAVRYHQKVKNKM